MARATPRLLLLAAVFWFAGVPVLAVFWGAFHGSPRDPGFTTRYIAQVFLSGDYLRPMVNSVELALYSGGLATLIGAALAWAMTRLALPRRELLEIGIMTPSFMSPFIGAIGWITLAAPKSGMLNVMLAEAGLPGVDVFSYAGTVMLMAVFFAPYAYAMLRHTMERLNPEMEEAAAIAGASPWRTTLGITLPLLWPALLSALIFTFILSVEMFSIPGILLVPQGFDFLSYSIFVRTTRWPLNHSEAAAAGVMLLLLTLAGIALYAWVVRVQERFISIGPKAPRLVPSGHGIARHAGLALIVVYIVVSVVLPTGAIALRSLLPYYDGSWSLARLSLANIQGVLGDALVRNALMHSIVVTVVATGLLLGIAFLVALGKARRRDAISRVTALIASVPIAVPGLLFGVGLIWLYVRTPIYATIWIIVVVMLGRFLPILVRMFENALMQIGRELEEAAAVCGASDWTITRTIRLPLLLSTIRSAIAIGGTQVFNELTASALLFTASSSVLPVVVFNYMFDGDYSRAAAVALLQIALLVAGYALVTLATRRSARWREAAAA